MTTPTPTPPVSSVAPKKMPYWLDLLERIGATAAEAAIGYGATQLAGISPAYAIPIGAVAAALKGWLAKFTGQKDNASLVQ